MTSRALLHVVLAVMAATVLFSFAPSAEGAWTDHSNATHVLLKADGSLSPGIDPDANASIMHVEADYDDLGSMRVNRRWVDIGTWSVALDVDWQAAGGLTTVTFWYEDIDEGYTNSPQFNVTLNVSGAPVANGTADGPDDADSPTQVNVTLDLSAEIQVSEGEAMELYLEFIGWEDIDFYYDNTTFPSGWTQDSTSLLLEGISGTDRTVDLEFVDAFDVDWTMDPDRVYAYAHPAGEPGGDQDPAYRLHNFTVLAGDPVQVGNSTKATTVLRFEANMSEGNWTIGARFGYNRLSHLHEVSANITIEENGTKTWVVDDDDGKWRDFGSIQDAVDAASDGDTILVYAGTYFEPGVRVNRTVTIIGNGTAGTTVDTEYEWNVSYVMSIENQSVVLRGLCLRRNYWAGLRIVSDDNVVQDILVTDIDDGGIEIVNAEGNVVTDSVLATRNGFGMTLQNSTGSRIEGCTVRDNLVGIRLTASSWNVVSGNNVSDNAHTGILCTGGSVPNTFIGNEANGNMIGMAFDDGSDRNYIGLSMIEMNDYGVNITGCSDIKLENVTIDSVENDLYLDNSTGVASLNCTFSTVAMSDGSDLTASHFLHVLVLSENDSSPIEGADLRVRDANTTVYASAGFGGSDLATDANGSVSWIEVIGTVYSSGPNGTTDETAHVNRIKAMYDGWDEERSIHFTVSRNETFLYREPYNGTTIYVDDDNAGDTTMDGSPEHPFDTVQRGIDNSSAGHTVRVFDGTYRENVRINVSRLSVIGNGTDTIIIGNGTGDVVRIDVADVLLSGFNVSNSGSGVEDAGILVDVPGLVTNVTVDLVLVHGCQRGIFIDNPVDVFLFNVTARGNTVGVYVDGSPGSSHLNLSGVDAIGNSGVGIYVSRVAGPFISGGEVRRNGDDGVQIDRSDGAGLAGVSLRDNSGDGVGVVESDDVRIVGCTLGNNTRGVSMSGSEGSRLLSCALSGPGTSGTSLSAASDGFEVQSSSFSGLDIAIDVNECTDGVVGNTTIASSSTADIRLSGLAGSSATAYGCQFDGDKVVCSQRSTLEVRNLLRVRVRNQYGDDIQYADVKVEDNDDPVYASEGYSGSDPRTDRNGYIPWFWVTDRIYDGSNSATENETTAYARKGKNETIVDVDMSSGHIEVIVVNVTEEGILYVDDDNEGDPQMDGSRKHPYDTIAKAMEAAEPGDTVRIWNGTYREAVNASVGDMLILGNGTGTVIDADGASAAVVLNADNVTVDSVRIANAETGILLDDVVEAGALDIVFLDVSVGISGDGSSSVRLEGLSIDGADTGIDLSSCTDILVRDVSIANALTGLVITGSSSFELHGVEVTDSGEGIVIESSTNGKMRNCLLSRNTYNFGVLGTTKRHHSHDIDISNKVNGKAIYYFVDRVDPVSLKGSLGFVGLVGTGGTVDVSVEPNLMGVLVAFSSDVNISGDMSHSRIGIVVISSSDVAVVDFKATDVKNGTVISASSGLAISESDLSSSGAGMELRNVADAAVVNTTIDSGTSFNLWSSSASTLDVSFGDDVIVSSSSRLIVRNHLHIHVNASAGGDLEGADAKVEDDGKTIYASSGYGGDDPQTDPDGYIRWIVVTDRVYDGSAVATENTTGVEVKFAAWTESRPDVDMSRAHTEWFDENPPANKAPTCFIIDPRDGDKVGGQYDVFGNASDDDGVVTDVFVRIDSGSWIHAEGTDSWLYRWNTEEYTDGQHWIYAKSRDDLGAESDTHSIRVVVDNSNYPPNASIVQPEDGSVVEGTVTIEGTADDPEGEMVSVDVAIVPEGSIPGDDDWSQATDTSSDDSWETWEFEWDTTGPNRTADGNYSVFARARDAANHTGQDRIGVYVDNPDKPNVAIKEPDQGDEIQGPLVIKGTADDPDLDGGVEAVYVAVVERGVTPKGNDWKEAEDTSDNSSTAYSSWEYAWDTEDEKDGNYSIHARAYDGEEMSDDLVINVSVDNINELPHTATVQPTEGTDVSQIIDVKGYAIDPDDNIDRVEVSIDDVEFKENKLSVTLQRVAWDRWNWSARWDTRNYEPGNHTILSRSIDKRDGISNVYRVNVTVWENVPPKLTFTNPADGEDDHVWKGEQSVYYIQWSDDDPDDNASIKFFFTEDREEDGTRIPGIYYEDTRDEQGREVDLLEWNIGGVPEGDYYLCAVLEDSADNVVKAFSKGRVLVREGTPNVPPTMDITQPDGVDDVIEVNGTFVIWFNASDDDGDTLSIYLYRDDDTDRGNGYAPVTNGSISGSAVSFEWDTTGVPRGTYYILGAVEDGVNDAVWTYSDGMVSVGDLVKPSGVKGLAAEDPGFGGTIILTWTAPGDDGDDGRASAYEVRFSSSGSITTSNWADATPFANDVQPVESGASETLVVTGLDDDVPQYWIAVRAVDDEGNVGPVVQVTAASSRVSRSAELLDMPAGFGGDLSWLGYGSVSGIFDSTPYNTPYGLADIDIFIEVTATGHHTNLLMNITYTGSITGVDPATVKLYRRSPTGSWTIVAGSDHDIDGKRIWGHLGHLTVFAPLASGLPPVSFTGFTYLPTDPDEDDDITVEITVRDPAGRTPTEIFVETGGKRYDMAFVEGEATEGMLYRAVLSLKKGSHDLQVVVRIGEDAEFRSGTIAVEVDKGESEGGMPWAVYGGAFAAAMIALLLVFILIIRPKRRAERARAEAAKVPGTGIAPPLAKTPADIVEAEVYEAPGIVVEGEEGEAVTAEVEEVGTASGVGEAAAVPQQPTVSEAIPMAVQGPPRGAPAAQPPGQQRLRLPEPPAPKPAEPVGPRSVETVVTDLGKIMLAPCPSCGNRLVIPKERPVDIKCARCEEEFTVR